MKKKILKEVRKPVKQNTNEQSKQDLIKELLEYTEELGGAEGMMELLEHAKNTTPNRIP